MPPGRAAIRVLLVYADRVGASMGGMGIRGVELARVLRDTLTAEVTIAAAETDGGAVGCPVMTYAPHAPLALDGPLASADVVVAQPGWPLTMRRLARSRARLVFDMYDPEAFETLEHFAGRRPRLRALMAAFAADRLQEALRRGHHIMCASERQRDLWLGAMLADGLLTPEAYDRDPSARSFIDVVPYGLPPTPPVADGRPLRERLGLADDDDVVLWNGGLWSWLDARTAIRAMARLRERRPRAHLVFMGTSDAAPALRATTAARALARELGLLGSGVLFNDEWVPYSERGDWLLDADCALSTHADHLETRFAFRTRLLDCLWAGLPIVCTGGDELASQVAREDLGAAVAPGDVAAVVAALETVLERGRDAYASRMARAAAGYAWPRVAEPLVRWLQQPAPNAPLGAGRGFDRRLSERARTAGYLALAGPAEALGLPTPRLR